MRDLVSEMLALYLDFSVEMEVEFSTHAFAVSRAICLLACCFSLLRFSFFSLPVFYLPELNLVFFTHRLIPKKICPINPQKDIYRPKFKNAKIRPPQSLYHIIS